MVLQLSLCVCLNTPISSFVRLVNNVCRLNRSGVSSYYLPFQSNKCVFLRKLWSLLNQDILPQRNQCKHINGLTMKHDTMHFTASFWSGHLKMLKTGNIHNIQFHTKKKKKVYMIGQWTFSSGKWNKTVRRDVCGLKWKWITSIPWPEDI